MENVWHLVVLSLGLLFLKFCGGFPIDLESADLHNATIWTTLTPLLAVAFLVTSVLFVLGCVCCRQNKGFQEFTDSTSSHSLSAAGGYVNSAASTTEFTIFPPAQAATAATLAAPPPNRLSVPGDRSSVVRFEPLPDIRLPQPHGIRPAAFNNAVSHGLSSQDWFQDPHVNFPRQQLKYLRELGRGWFGRVVEGEAQNIEPEQKTSKVVVKILHEDATTTDQMYFLHEVKPYRELSHPNILKLLGRCLETDPFLVLLEASPSGDLKSFLSQNIATAEALSQQGVTLRMCCNIASGLLYMHDNGFVHTDLAARNCVVTPDLTVKIGDYGTSIETYKEDYYCAGEVALPIRWCAPETLHCTETTIETKEVTMSANVWSLGVVLWEICEFGKLPYSELSDDEVIVKVLGEGKHRLGLPSLSCPQRQNLYLLMKLCWHSLPERPLLLQVHSMLNHLHSSRERYSQDGDNSSLKTDEDFERRWEMFKPNTIPKTDNHITSSETTPVVQSPTHSTADSPMRNPPSDVTGARLESVDESLRPRSLILQPAAFESMVSSRDSGNLTVDGSSTTPLTTSPQPSLASSSGGEFFIPSLQHRHKSPSLQNLRGSIDDLSEVANVPVWQKTGESDDVDHTSDIVEKKEGEAGPLDEIKEKESEEVISLEPDFDSWLKGVETTNEEDAKFVRKISEAIRDLDNALALEKTSSSSSSEASSKSVSHQSPVKDTATVLSEQNVVLDFRLGRADSGVSSDDKEMMFQPDSLQDDSFIEHAKSVHIENRATDSGTDTEDETWRKRIERGEFSEKVKEKSKSVADLMVLTHIECSDGSDSDTPSLTWCFERSSNGRSSFTTKLRPGSVNKNSAVVCSSESNIHEAVLGEEFKDTLKKLHEAQRENKTLKQEPLLLNPLSEDSHSSNHEKEENFLANDASEEFTMQEGEGVARSNREVLTKYAITEKSLQSNNVAGSSDVAQVDAFMKDTQSSSSQVPEEDSACSSASISDSQDVKDCNSKDIVSVLASVDSSMSEVLDDNVPHLHVIESSLHSVVKDISSDNCDLTSVSLLESDNLSKSEMSEDSSVVTASKPLFTSTPHISQYKEEDNEPVHRSAIRRLDYCETMPTSSVSSLSPSRTYSSDASVEPLETSYNDSVSSSYVLSDSFQFSPADKNVNKLENLHELSPETSAKFSSSSQENVPLASAETNVPAPFNEVDRKECLESVASNVIPSVVLGPCEEYTLDYFKGLKTTSGGESENIDLTHSEDISYLGKDVYHGEVPEENQPKPMLDYCITSWEKHLSSSFKEHEPEVSLFDIGFNSGADSLLDKEQLANDKHRSTDTPDANIDQDSLNLEHGVTDDINLSNLSVDDEFLEDSSQKIFQHDSNSMFEDVFELLENPQKGLENETIASTNKKNIELDLGQEITNFSPIMHSTSAVQETGMLKSERNDRVLTADILPEVNEKLMTPGLCIPSLNFIAATPIPSGRNTPEMYEEESAPTPDLSQITDTWNENFPEENLPDGCKDNLKNVDYNNESKVSATNEEPSVTVNEELALTNTMGPDLEILPNVSFCAGKNYEAHSDLELDDVLVNLEENTPGAGIGVTLENVDTPMNVSEIQSSLDASEKVNDLIGTLKEIPDLDKIVEKVNSETDKICMESEHTNTSSSVNSLYDMKENSEITLSNKIEDIPLEETISSSDIVVKTADSFEIPTSIDKSMNVSISEMSGERITNFASSPKETEKEGNSTDIFPVLDNSGITSNDVKSDVKEEMQNGVNVNNEPIMTEMVATTNNAGIVLSNSLNESENLNVNTQQNTVETNNNEYISDPLDKTRVVVGSEIVHESSSKELTSIEMPLVDVETISSNNITHVTDTEGFINSTEITHKPNNLPALSDEVQEESKMEKVVYGVSDKLENNDSLHELTEIVSNDNVNAKGSCLLIDKHLGIEDFSVVDNMDTNNVKDNLGESSSDTAMNNNLIGTSETFHIVSNEVSSTDLENTHLFEIQSKAPSVLNDSKKSIPSQSLKCNQLPEYEESNTSQKYIVQNVLSPESIICKTQDFLDNEKNIKSVNMLSDRSHIEKELSALKETNTSLINCHNLNVLDEEDRNTNSVEEIACKRKISKEDNLLSSIELCDPLYMKHSRHFVGDDGGIWLAHSKCEPYQKLDTNIKMEGVMDSNITLSPDSLKIHNEGMLKRESKYINDDLTNMNTKEISEKQSLPDVSIELQKDKLEDAFALSAVKSYDLPLEIVGPKLQENETSALNPLNELVTEEPIEIKFSNYSDLALIPDTKINNDNSSMDFFNCDQDTLGPNKGMHFNTNAVGDSQENKMSPNSDNLSYEQMSVDVDMKHPMDVFNEKEANRVSTVIDSWKQKQFDSNSRTLMEDFLLGERLASGLSASALEIKTEELPETYETAGDAEDDSEDFGLDAVKHSTPDDERSSDSGFRDKGSLSESCEDACDEKYNLEDIEAELEETFNKGGFTYVEKHDENEHSEHVHEDVQRKLSTKSSDDSAFNYIEKTEEEDQRRLTPGNSCDSTDNKEFFENGHNKSLLVPEDDVNAVQTMEPSKQIETFGEATLLEEAIDEEQLKQMLGITDGVKASAAFLKIECGMESHYMSPEFFQQEDLISQTFENSKPDSLNLSDDSIESVLLVQSPTDKQDRSLTKLSNISVPCESDSSLDLGTRDYNHEEIVEQVTENISEELMENHLENASLTVGTEDVEVDAEVSDNSGHISPEKSSSMLINAAKLDVTSLETFHAEDISESGVESESESRDLQREAASTPTSGWYLHPPPKSGSCDSGVNYSEEDERSNANAEDYPSPTNSGSCSSKIDDSNNSENSYVSFSLDEEFVTAIRNELREKLPCSSQQSQEEDSEEDEILDPDDELSSEDRTDIMIHYNSYPAPLSPILEERESVSSITTTVSDHYSPFASSNQRDVTKSGSDSEPVSPVFVLDSKEDSRTKYEVDAKKFEQEIREALENCSFSSSEESGSSCDKNRKAASVLFEDLEQQSTEDAQNLSVDVTVNGKNVVVVRGTNQHPEDDDLLVVNTETNEATLLESPKPKSHLAFVNSKKTILENKISVDDLSATPDFFSEDELAIGVNSDTFVIDRNRFEETFEKDCELSRRKETSSDDEVYTPDSISPEHATGTPSASSLQSPDTENLSEFFLTPSEKSPTSSDYPNSPPGPQNSAVYNPYFLHTLANNDDNPTYEKVEEIHLVANNEAEEIISELENSGIINTNNNRTEREFLSDVKTDIQEVTSSRTSSVIDDSEVTSTEESSESPEFVIKDFEENGNSVGRVKQLSAVDRLEYLTSPNLDVFAMKMDGSPESVDSQEEKENALNGNNYSRRLLLNDTLDLFKKQKEDVEEEKDWSLPNLEAAMLSTKAPMPSPEEESWKQIPSMLAFSDLNEVMARCGSGSNSCIPYGGQAEVEEGDLMSTSFSVKGDPEDQDCYTPDWESDSDETNDDDNNSSSSGEFIWKEGDKESSVKAIDISASSNTSKPYEGLSDFPMEVIAEEEEDEEEDDDADGSSSSGSGTEFVPSAWNSEATPNRSALRSPDKKSDQKKNVSFKKQKYHCVYEYPRETSDSDSEGFDSPTRRHWNSLVYQQPQVDYSSFADWELMDGDVLPDGSGHDTDTDPDVPETTSQQQLDFYKLSSVDYDFGNGMMSEDGEFYISSSARPFQFSSGNNDVLSNGSQFFPGQLYNMSDCKSVDFITPDSGIIDVTSADKFTTLEAGVDSYEDEVDTSPSSISRFAVSFNDHLLSRKSNSIKDIAWEDEVDSSGPDINQTSSNVSSSTCSEVGVEKTSVESVKVQESTLTEAVDQPKILDTSADGPVLQSPVSSCSKSHHSSVVTDNSKDKDGETASQSPSSPLSPSGLGELRHTRDRLKLDLPTSSKAFVLDPPAVGKRRSVETVKGEASLLDSGEETEDSGIESSNGAATSLKIASEDTSKS